MNNITLTNELTGKNEQLAIAAAKEIIDSSNTDAFSLLVEKTEFLFDFIKANVNRRLESVVDENNFRNLIQFLNYYSPDLEEFVAGSLAKYANEDLTDELLELLESGNDNQKAYCAKYFTYILDTTSCELLMEYAFDDNESLAYNSAQALGKMHFELGYNMALEMINAEDDFVVLKAVKFLVAYGDKAAVPEILRAMKNSAMAENIAGELPFLETLPVLLEAYQDAKEDVLFAVSKILSGLGEILPLSQIFSFEIYDVLCELINENDNENENEEKKSGLIAVILLKALSKFEMISDNDQYTFDEDNNTKSELKEILNLLKNKSYKFWDEQKDLVKNELSQEKERILSALHLISELKINNALDELKKLSESEDEVLICEAVCTLKALDKTNIIDKETVLLKISDENKKAIIENCF